MLKRQDGPLNVSSFTRMFVVTFTLVTLVSDWCHNFTYLLRACNVLGEGLGKEDAREATICNQPGQPSKCDDRREKRNFIWTIATIFITELAQPYLIGI